ncbi:PQQ-binding-like beta-propeller repeat protein [Streptomyces sedi]|uniref:Pyrrolo-quinoline quinone repeat domain-containing protein n=1 Tax=Streptomyces sedi TaxID=555059 RepID=A0A5C4URA5_9ACTN|nr:PQQ-binding-like beta-propeller repeat protein [Streptomyces sedi]TNM26028.1 hypothetical protein FH715_24945 [Streptomyces sedi]
MEREKHGQTARGMAKWTAHTAAPVIASPRLCGKTLIVADAGGSVYAFHALTGEERWRRADPVEDWREHGVPFSVTPAVWNEWLFVEAVGGLHILDLRSGEFVGELAHHGCPTVVGNLLLVHHVSGGVRAFGLPDLAPRWSRGWTGWLRASPTVHEHELAYAVLGFEEQRTHGGLLAFDPSTGDEVFRRRDAVERCPLSEGAEDWLIFSSVPAVVGEGLVWLPRDRGHDEGHRRENDDPAPWNDLEIVGLDPRTGVERRCHRLHSAHELYASGAIVVSDGTLYVGAALYEPPSRTEEPEESGALYAVDAASGTVRWSRRFGGAIAAAPVADGGTVYVASEQGEISALASATGRVLWNFEAGARISHPHALFEREPTDSYDQAGAAVVKGEETLYVRTDLGVVAFQVPAGRDETVERRGR